MGAATTRGGRRRAQAALVPTKNVVGPAGGWVRADCSFTAGPFCTVGLSGSISISSMASPYVRQVDGGLLLGGGACTWEVGPPNSGGTRTAPLEVMLKYPTTTGSMAIA